MSLIDDLAAQSLSSSSRPGDCKMCSILAKLPEDEREAVSAALASTLGADTLADILTRNGSPIGATTIKQHRRKGHTA